MSKNRIRIEASTLKLELSGDTEQIERAYEMTRTLLLTCFEDQLRNADTAPTPTARADRDDSAEHASRLPAPPRPIANDVRDAIIAAQRHEPTQRLYTTPEVKTWTPPNVREMAFLNLVLSSDFYNKVCVLERATFEQSMLEEVFHFDGLHRVHIPHEQQAFFSELFDIGKVVWRELTREGQRAVRSEGPSKK